MLPVITSTKFLFFFVSFSASYSRQGLPLKVCRRVAQFENQTLLGFMQISLSRSLSLSLASGNFKTKPFLESSQRSPPLKEKRNWKETNLIEIWFPLLISSLMEGFRVKHFSSPNRFVDTRSEIFLGAADESVRQKCLGCLAEFLECVLAAALARKMVISFILTWIRLGLKQLPFYLFLFQFRRFYLAPSESSKSVSIANGHRNTSRLVLTNSYWMMAPRSRNTHQTLTDGNWQGNHLIIWWRPARTSFPRRWRWKRRRNCRLAEA